jgi:hypothetical protein
VKNVDDVTGGPQYGRIDSTPVTLFPTFTTKFHRANSIFLYRHNIGAPVAQYCFKRPLQIGRSVVTSFTRVTGKNIKKPTTDDIVAPGAGGF